MNPEDLVTIIGPCTQDYRDCEVWRAAFANKDTDPNNAYSKELRKELAKVACQECWGAYLSDVEVN